MSEEMSERLLILLLSLMIGVVVLPVLFVLSKAILFIMAIGNVGTIILYLIIVIILQVILSGIFE